MHTDPIADMLTRIRNAQMVKKTEVVLPYSKLKFNIAKILEKENWIAKAEEIEPLALKKNSSKGVTQSNKKGTSLVKKNKNAKFKQIKIILLYKNNKSKINSIKKISTPGRRVYVKKDDLPIVSNNLGIAIISTSKGLLTNKEAKKEHLGGEIICEIY